MPINSYRELEERLPEKTSERSAHIKAELYEHGLRITQNALKQEIGTKYKENQYGYDNPNEEVNNRLPSEIVLPANKKTQGKRGVVSAFRQRKDSPFLVRYQNGGFELHYEGEDVEETQKISDMRIPPRPGFWDKKTERGVIMKRIGNIYGTDCYNVCVRNHCQFWGTGSQCKFCSINTTHSIYDNVELQKQVDDVAEIAVEAFKEDMARVATFTGGSFWNHNKEIRFYIDMLNEVSDRLGRDKLRNFVLITMPPLDFELIDELYDTGLEFVDFNMEAYSQQAFGSMLPGKDKYGRDKFLDALDYAADVFGEGKAWTNLIVPLGEDKETIKRGFEELCEMGVNPGGNVFHPDMQSQLQNKEPPNSEYVKDVYRYGADLLHQYGYKPFLTDNTMRGSLMWEAYYGWI